MNSKEALENLTYCVNGMERQEKYYKIIKKDLDRLEKLEKVIEILKELFFIDLIERENDYKLGFEPKEPIINQPRFAVVNLNKEICEQLKEVLRND